MNWFPSDNPCAGRERQHPGDGAQDHTLRLVGCLVQTLGEGFPAFFGHMVLALLTDVLLDTAVDYPFQFAQCHVQDIPARPVPGIGQFAVVV